jgi:hypothetical protein
MKPVIGSALLLPARGEKVGMRRHPSKVGVDETPLTRPASLRSAGRLLPARGER